MRFHLGAIPASDNADWSAGWKPLREPHVGVFFVAGLLIGGILCALVVALWIQFTPITTNPAANPVLLSICLAAIIPVHELLHAVVHPQFGFSPKTIVGCWPRWMLCYAHYEGPLSRRRLLAVLAMPSIVLTVLPLLACSLFDYGSVTLGFISAMNALAAGGDALAISLFVAQVPPGGTIQNNGWRSYWRKQ
jgi:hypothetical protein